jgi:stage III sporulation protein AA
LGERIVRVVRVAVADERGELAAVKNGVPQLDVGRCSDVLDMAPRGEAAMFLIRAMNPQVLAMDEISSAREREAVLAAAGCGTAIFATAHGFTAEEAMEAYRYRELFDAGVFDCAVGIEGSGLNRRFRVVKRDGL